MLKKFGMVASVLALLAVAGCKNGMLGEDEATVNGLRDVGGRTARVTVTNFADNGDGATRSVVGAPLRTIAPTTPDVKAGYTFIIEGKSGRNVLPETVVTIDPNGRVDLANLVPGQWSLLLTAYETAKLGGATDALGIVARKADAAVLSGSATVDLTRSSGDVLITLTPRNIGTEGTVNLTVDFDNNDMTKIQGSPGGYTVTIGLYDRATGLAIGPSETNVTATLEGGQRTVTYNITGQKIPVGEYTFKVSITDTTGAKGPWYWSDNLFVHGNMETAGTVSIDELLGGNAPADPSDFAAYWSNVDVTKRKADGSEYTVHFAWNRKSFNESGFELQIADITGQFDPITRQYDGENADSANNLWGEIEDKQPQFSNVTVITEKDFSRVNYPIYDKQGSLTAGSTYVDYVLPTGRIYAARLRATNANGNSNWIHLNEGLEPNSKWDAGAPTGGSIQVVGASKLNEYYFDVFSITYQLNNFILLKNAEQVTDAVKGDVDFVAYNFAQGYEVKYKVAQNAGDGNYQLYKADFPGPAAFDSPDRVKSWNGWSNVTDRADTNVYSNQPGKKYEGYSNATFTPAGASGGLTVDVITAGTFKDLLTEDTVFIQLKEETNQTTPQGIPGTWNGKKWNEGITDIKGAGQSQFGSVNTKKGIRLPDTIQQNIKDFLCVTVGKSDADIGTLEINTGNGVRDTNIYQMAVTLEQNGSIVASGMSNPGDTFVYVDVTTLAEGDYTLRLMAIPMEGYGFSFQRPFVVKCSSTVIP